MTSLNFFSCLVFFSLFKFYAYLVGVVCLIVLCYILFPLSLSAIFAFPTFGFPFYALSLYYMGCNFYILFIFIYCLKFLAQSCHWICAVLSCGFSMKLSWQFFHFYWMFIYNDESLIKLGFWKDIKVDHHVVVSQIIKLLVL